MPAGVFRKLREMSECRGRFLSVLRYLAHNSQDLNSQSLTVLWPVPQLFRATVQLLPKVS